MTSQNRYQQQRGTSPESRYAIAPVWAIAIILLCAASACSDDASSATKPAKESPVRCGAGTVLVRQECLPDASGGQPSTSGGAPNTAAGAAGKPDDEAGGSSSTTALVRCGAGTVLVAGECVVGSRPGTDDDIISSGGNFLGGPSGAAGEGDGTDGNGTGGDGTDGNGTGGDGAGVECLPGPMPAPSAGACVTKADMLPCNPVTGGGCPNGQRCTIRFNTNVPAIACTAEAELTPMCSVCFDGSAVSDCSPGTFCGTLNKCQSVCCNDEDCAAGTTCLKQQGRPFGICQEQYDGWFVSR